MKKVLAKMAEHIAADAINPEEKILASAIATVLNVRCRRKIDPGENKCERLLYCRYGRNYSMYANDGGINIVL